MTSLLKTKLELDPYPFKIYFTWRLLIITYQVFIETKIWPTSLSLYQKLYLNWVNVWDGVHYLNISQNGYVYPDQAFLPLWPMFIKILSVTGASIFESAYILSILFSLLSFCLFYKLAKVLLISDQAKSTLILFACFPSSFFLLTGYSESLFLFLTLLSFYLLEIKYLWLSALVGGFSTLTRFAGVGLALSYLSLKVNLRAKLTYFFLGISGLVLYSFYLYWNFGKPLYFFEAVREWGRFHDNSLVVPLWPLVDYLLDFFRTFKIYTLYYYIYDWWSSFLFLIGSIFVLKKLGLNYFIYTLFVLVLPLSSGKTLGMVRYCLAAFPVFLVAPTIVRYRLLFYSFCFLLFLIQLWLITLFTHNLWVA